MDQEGKRVGTAAIHAHLLDGADADDLRRGVVAAVDLDGAGDQFAGDLVHALSSARRCRRFVSSLHLVVQAVGAENQHIAGLERERGGVGGDKHLRAERADEDVARIGVGDLVGGDQAHLALLVDQRMVLRDLPGLSVADQVAAGVADVRDDGLIVAEGAGDEGGGHFLAAIFGGEGAIVDGGIGVLDEARQQADEHGAGLRLGKLLGHDGDGGREATSPRSMPPTPSATAKR